MNEPMKKMGIFMTLAMGISISVILATWGVVMSGHFTIGMWLISVVLSVIIALFIGFVLPVRKLAGAATQNIKNPLAKLLLENLITNIFYAVIITTILECVMIGMANRGITNSINQIKTEMQQMESTDSQYLQMQMQISSMEEARPSVAKVLPKSLISSYVIAYVLGVILQPIYVNIGRKKYLKTDKE